MEKKRVKKSAAKGRRKEPKGLFQRPWFMVTTVGIAALLFGGIWAANTLLRTHGGEDVWIRIPGGASEQALKDSVIAALGPDQGGRVISLWGMMGGDAVRSHGAYRVSGGQTAFRTARNLAHGRQTPVTVTWNNVRTFSDLAAAVARNLEFKPEDFRAACREVLEPEGFNEATFPAAFLPDSYEFYWAVSPEEAVRKLYSYRVKFWTPERKAKADALGLDETGVAIIASIAEEETSKADELGKVARLYVNRLNAGMPLQADPTVKFALGDFSIRRISSEMLRTSSPFNTYRMKGLPPGPIRVPSKASLDAVLNATPHDWLYMCAKEDFSGYHNFSRSYEEHLANARRYQAELDRRNIH